MQRSRVACRKEVAQHNTQSKLRSYIRKMTKNRVVCRFTNGAQLELMPQRQAASAADFLVSFKIFGCMAVRQHRQRTTSPVRPDETTRGSSNRAVRMCAEREDAGIIAPIIDGRLQLCQAVRAITWMGCDRNNQPIVHGLFT